MSNKAENIVEIRFGFIQLIRVSHENPEITTALLAIKNKLSKMNDSISIQFLE